MTLKAIESKFTELLEQQAIQNSGTELTLDREIITKPLPSMVWSELLFSEGMPHSLPEFNLPGFGLQSFPSMEDAITAHPGVSLRFEGRPWALHQFLISDDREALISLGKYGTAYLSKEPLAPNSGDELCHHLIPIWFNYALSPDLWGPEGKWTKFHGRLLKLFTDHNLLDGKPSLGYYPLQTRAEILREHGFEGTLLDKTYLLVTPWDFSLNDLVKLEQVIRQEF